jgi:N-acetylneuraminic acid mutarotase
MLVGRTFDVFKFDLETKVWTAVTGSSGTLPLARSGHTATAAGHKVYIFGGEDQPEDVAPHEYNGAGSKGERVKAECVRADFGDIFTYDTQRDHWVADRPQNQCTFTAEGLRTPVPTARRAHSMVYVANGELKNHPYDSLWMFGGAGPDLIRGLDHVFDDLFLFNIESQKWMLQKPVGHRLPPREGHTTTMIKDVMFIIGGADSPHRKSSTDTVFAINLDTLVTADIYMQNGLNPKALYGHSAVWNQFRPGEIIVFGGRNEVPMANTQTNTSGMVWRLDTGMNTLPEHAKGGGTPAGGGEDFTYMPKYMPKWSNLAVPALSLEPAPVHVIDPEVAAEKYRKMTKQERKKKRREEKRLLAHPEMHVVRRKGPSQRTDHAMVSVGDCWAFLYGGLDIRCGIGNCNADSWLLRFVYEDDMYRQTVEANVIAEIAAASNARIAKLNASAKKGGSGARTRIPREKHMSPLEKFRQGTIEQKLMEGKMKMMNRLAQRKLSQSGFTKSVDLSKDEPRPKTPLKPEVAVGKFLPGGAIPSLASRKTTKTIEYKDRRGMTQTETREVVEQQSYVSVVSGSRAAELRLSGECDRVECNTCALLSAVFAFFAPRSHSAAPPLCRSAAPRRVYVSSFWCSARCRSSTRTSARLRRAQIHAKLL